jgi:hypothetical protein
MEETETKVEIKVLTDDEAWGKGLVQKALAMCEEGDLLVGIVQSRGGYYAVICTVKGAKRYLQHFKL